MMKPGFYKFEFRDGRRDIVRVVNDNIASGTMETPASTVKEYEQLGRFGALLMALGKTEGGPDAAELAKDQEAGVEIIQPCYVNHGVAARKAAVFARWLGPNWIGQVHRWIDRTGFYPCAWNGDLRLALLPDGKLQAVLGGGRGLRAPVEGVAETPTGALLTLEARLGALRDSFDTARVEIGAIRAALPLEGDQQAADRPVTVRIVGMRPDELEDEGR